MIANGEHLLAVRLQASVPATKADRTVGEPQRVRKAASGPKEKPER